MLTFVCLNCGSKYVFARGLCRKCHKLPDVRKAYPPDRSNTSRGVGTDSYGKRDLPAEPTDAPPGSERKIAVLEQRAKEGVELFHPLDNLMRRREVG